MKYKSLVLAAAALMAGTLSLGGAQAANVMTGSGAPAGITTMQDSNIQDVARRYWRRGGNWNGGNWNRHGHNHHNNNGAWLGLGLGLGLLPFYGGYGGYGYGYGGGPYYSEPYYYSGGGGGHVNWCINRYRTYDPRSNTFRGYDGLLHQCRSPYRY